MSDIAEQLFRNKVNATLTQVAKRVADRNFFQDVLRRLNSGESLSNEMNAFKLVDRKQAIAVVKKLIQRCNQELVGDCWRFASQRIKTQIQTDLESFDILPSYRVEYEIRTRVGTAIVQVHTVGVYFKIDFDTSGCSGYTRNEVLNEISKLMSFEVLQ